MALNQFHLFPSGSSQILRTLKIDKQYKDLTFLTLLCYIWYPKYFSINSTKPILCIKVSRDISSFNDLNFILFVNVFIIFLTSCKINLFQLWNAVYIYSSSWIFIENYIWNMLHSLILLISYINFQRYVYSLLSICNEIWLYEHSKHLSISTV